MTRERIEALIEQAKQYALAELFNGRDPEKAIDQTFNWLLSQLPDDDALHLPPQGILLDKEKLRVDDQRCHDADEQ